VIIYKTVIVHTRVVDKIINNNNEIYIKSHHRIFSFYLVNNLYHQQLIKFNFNFDASHAPFWFWRPVPSHASIVSKGPVCLLFIDIFWFVYIYIYYRLFIHFNLSSSFDTTAKKNLRYRLFELIIYEFKYNFEKVLFF
jgi:hypothetical protein